MHTWYGKDNCKFSQGLDMIDVHVNIHKICFRSRHKAYDTARDFRMTSQGTRSSILNWTFNGNFPTYILSSVNLSTPGQQFIDF